MVIFSLYLRDELLGFCIEQSMKRKITTTEYIKQLILEKYKSVHNTLPKQPKQIM